MDLRRGELVVFIPDGGVRAWPTGAILIDLLLRAHRGRAPLRRRRGERENRAAVARAENGDTIERSCYGRYSVSKPVAGWLAQLLRSGAAPLIA